MENIHENQCEDQIKKNKKYYSIKKRECGTELLHQSIENIKY